MTRALLLKAWDGSLNAAFVARTKEVMVVNPIEFTVLTLPGRNWEWLKMLKALAWSSSEVLSVVLNFFTTVKSQLLVRGVASVLRPAVAKAPRLASIY